MLSRFLCRRGGVHLRFAVVAHQGFLSGRGHPGLPVLPGMVRSAACRGSTITMTSGAIEVPTREAVHGHTRLPARQRASETRYLVVADDRRRAHLDRLQPCARPLRALLDGDPRYGYRGRIDRHSAVAHQADRVCHLVPTIAVWPVPCMVFLWLGAAEVEVLRHQPCRS